MMLYKFLRCSGPDLEGRDRGRGGGGGGGGEEGGGGGDGPSFSSDMKKTAQQIAGERVLSRVVEEVEGVAFSFRCVCGVCVCVCVVCVCVCVVCVCVWCVCLCVCVCRNCCLVLISLCLL